MYEMTKDGFAFLVMGFTGAKAAAFKEAYINQFNAMETELKHRSPVADTHIPAGEQISCHSPAAVPING